MREINCFLHWRKPVCSFKKKSKGFIQILSFIPKLLPLSPVFLASKKQICGNGASEFRLFYLREREKKVGTELHHAVSQPLSLISATCWWDELLDQWWRQINNQWSVGGGLPSSRRSWHQCFSWKRLIAVAWRFHVLWTSACAWESPLGPRCLCHPTRSWCRAELKALASNFYCKTFSIFSTLACFGVFKAGASSSCSVLRTKQGDLRRLALCSSLWGCGRWHPS